MKATPIILGAVSALVLAATAYAHDDLTTGQDDVHGIVLAQVTPEEEKKQAQEMEASGPKETTGIKAVRPIGIVELEGEFEKPGDRVLRGRELDIEPGGIVAVHRHDGRPGIAYIVSGQLTEHRVGVDGPVVKQAGDTALENTGVIPVSYTHLTLPTTPYV